MRLRADGMVAVQLTGKDCIRNGRRNERTHRRIQTRGERKFLTFVKYINVNEWSNLCVGQACGGGDENILTMHVADCRSDIVHAIAVVQCSVVELQG